MIYPITLTVKMNGVRATIATTSDQTLADVLAENNIPYEGISFTVAGRKLNAADYEVTMGELGFAADTYLVSVKNMDCA